jgi:hypothetical protein
MADLDVDINNNAAHISTIKREIATAVYTIDALAAAHPPRLCRRRHAARLATAEADCAALERQYAELYTIQSTMRARRNASVSPLCRLPLELVVRILEHIAPFDLPYDRPVEWPEECVGWEPAMLVCTHLRAAALSSPALWARITDANRKTWYELCIRRSGATPLSISLIEHTSRPRQSSGTFSAAHVPFRTPAYSFNTSTTTYASSLLDGCRTSARSSAGSAQSPGSAAPACHTNGSVAHA